MTNALVRILVFFVILLVVGYAQLQESTNKRITELEKQVTELTKELHNVKQEPPLESKYLKN